MSILRERLQLPDNLTFDDYISIDDNLLSSEELTEADILAELVQSDVDEDAEVEEDDPAEEEPNICSLNEAKKYLQEVRRYFESRSFTSDFDFFSINKLESALLKNVPLRQPSIADFVKHH